MPEEKKYRPAIIFDHPPEETDILAKMNRHYEEKLFIIAYFNPINEKYEFETCTGRSECFRAVQRLCLECQMDPKEAKVIVEIIGRDREDSSKFKWFLMHPDDPKCFTAYQFYRAVENNYDTRDFDIDSYCAESEYGDEEEEKEVDMSSFILPKDKIVPSAFAGDAEVANAYTDIMAGMRQSSVQANDSIREGVVQMQDDVRKLFKPAAYDPFSPVIPGPPDNDIENSGINIEKI